MPAIASGRKKDDIELFGYLARCSLVSLTRMFVRAVKVGIEASLQ